MSTKLPINFRDLVHTHTISLTKFTVFFLAKNPFNFIIALHFLYHLKCTGQIYSTLFIQIKNKISVLYIKCVRYFIALRIKKEKKKKMFQNGSSEMGCCCCCFWRCDGGRGPITGPDGFRGLNPIFRLKKINFRPKYTLLPCRLVKSRFTIHNRVNALGRRPKLCRQWCVCGTI